MYDAVIIGSGPAGYECARKIAELNGKVAIVEKESLGGTCTNSGCIPTKALHASASFFSEIRKASRMGFKVDLPPVEMMSLIERKNRIVKVMSLGVRKLLEDCNVDIIKGEAKIRDRRSVMVSGRILETKNIVIATGAMPRMIEGVHSDDSFLTSTGLLDLQNLPSSLLIIGGGYIGCEFASIFSSLGVRVSIIEMMPRLLFNEDDDISREMAGLMQRQGVEIFAQSKIIKSEKNRVFFNYEGAEKSIEAEKILIAVGVDPFFNREEMKKIGVKCGRGITINSRMQTSIENVYAIGDVTDRIKLAHYAYAQADIAAKNIMGHAAEFDETTVPSAIFTIPEISSVGVRDAKLKSAKFSFAANGKARAMDEAEGFVKIFYEDGYLKGFCAIGPHASDLVSEAALAIKNRIPLENIKETIHAHPTLSEAFLGAVEIALKQSKK